MAILLFLAGGCYNSFGVVNGVKAWWVGAAMKGCSYPGDGRKRKRCVLCLDGDDEWRLRRESGEGASFVTRKAALKKPSAAS